MNMTIPTFIVIGAPRAGTTSLYHYLRQHPEVTLSMIKETNFFSYLASQAGGEYLIEPNTPWPVKNIKQYEALFRTTSNTKAVGEASPFYLYTPGIAYQIAKYIPNVRLILTLRNPIDRAYSAFLKNTREGLEFRTFEEAVQEEVGHSGKLIRSDKSYLLAGLYFRHLNEYLKIFTPSQFNIGFYEDFVLAQPEFLKNLFDFIGVDKNFKPDTSVQFNKAMPPLVKNNIHRHKIKQVTSRIRSFLPQKLYFSLLSFQNKINDSVVSYPPLSREMRLFLRDHFARDIEDLQKLLQRDLSHWLIVK